MLLEQFSLVFDKSDGNGVSFPIIQRFCARTADRFSGRSCFWRGKINWWGRGCEISGAFSLIDRDPPFCFVNQYFRGGYAADFISRMTGCFQKKCMPHR